MHMFAVSVASVRPHGAGRVPEIFGFRLVRKRTCVPSITADFQITIPVRRYDGGTLTELERGLHRPGKIISHAGEHANLHRLHPIQAEYLQTIDPVIGFSHDPHLPCQTLLGEQSSAIALIHAATPSITPLRRRVIAGIRNVYPAPPDVIAAGTSDVVCCHVEMEGEGHRRGCLQNGIGIETVELGQARCFLTQTFTHGLAPCLHFNLRRSLSSGDRQDDTRHDRVKERHGNEHTNRNPTESNLLQIRPSTKRLT